VAETGSTNADLLADLDAGVVGDRCVLAAAHQTAGRGRLDRRWEAPVGSNLLVSIVFSPTPEPAVDATHRVGLAALAAARDLRPEAAMSLKWPNDVLLGDHKLAGILAQRSSTRDAVVVGLGLNVGWAPEGAAHLGDPAPPAEVLALVLEHLDRLPPSIELLYRAALSTLGARVRVELPGGAVVDGVAVDVDPDGRLLVEDDAAVITAFDVGDVVHLRRSGRAGENGV
jgi:BirA family transcriptional regulator, biotin operon repressor / biotin---[acetyl-CoA-carboxylase] ligase